MAYYVKSDNIQPFIIMENGDKIGNYPKQAKNYPRMTVEELGMLFPKKIHSYKEAFLMRKKSVKMLNAILEIKKVFKGSEVVFVYNEDEK